MGKRSQVEAGWHNGKRATLEGWIDTRLRLIDAAHACDYIHARGTQLRNDPAPGLAGGTSDEDLPMPKLT